MEHRDFFCPVQRKIHKHKKTDYFICKTLKTRKLKLLKISIIKLNIDLC